MARRKNILKSLIKEEVAIPEIEQSQTTLFAQGKTGYCWLASALFFLSMKTGTENQGFSLEYLMYYDKLEKANHFLTLFMERMDEPLASPDNRYLLSNTISDRGQWGMAVNLIRKYGIVLCDGGSGMIPPRESGGWDVSSHDNIGVMLPLPTGELNACLSYMLRCFAKKIRDAYELGSTQEQLAEIKEEALQRVEHLLITYYGSPAEHIVLNNGNTITPQLYFKQYIGDFFDDYVSIISNDRMKLGQYVVDLDGNVSGGVPNTFLNVPEDVFCRAIDAQLDGDGCCWITADAGKFYLKSFGLFDDSIFDFSELCGNGMCDSVSRSDVWNYHLGNPVHTMVLLSESKTEVGYYRTFNSAFSEERSGSCLISRSWFSKYVLQAVVRKEYIPDWCRKRMGKSVEVKPWKLM